MATNPKGGMMAREAVLACSESTRLLVRSDADSDGVNMPVLTDKYVLVGREICRKTCKQSKQKARIQKQQKQKQEVANV